MNETQRQLRIGGQVQIRRRDKSGAVPGVYARAFTVEEVDSEGNVKLSGWMPRELVEGIDWTSYEQA